MSRTRGIAARNHRQRPDPDQGDAATSDLATGRPALDARLDDLDRTTKTLDQRLQAIEAHLNRAVATKGASASPPGAARELPVVPPPVGVLPPPAPIPADGITGPLPAAAHALLEGAPVSPRRRPDPSPTALTSHPRPSMRTPLPATSARRPSASLADLERAVSGRGLAWVGGLTLLLGVVFFFSLAISRGWIGPEARVAIGLVAGIVVTVLGDRLMRGGDRVLGPVLVAVGIGIWNLALVAGTRLYDLIPLWPALLGATAGAVVATAIAIRAHAQVIALYGMVTALAAPMLFAVPAAATPMAYLLIILAGSTAISIARGWSWLPPVAFVLSEVQFYSWWSAADAPKQEIVLVIAGLSLLNGLAAAGVDLWARTTWSRVNAITLLALNASSFAFVGAETLSDARLAFGSYLLAGAAAHVAIGTFILRRTRSMNAFTYSAFGIAAILLTSAIPVVFDGPPVAIAWAAEAVGLIWLAHRFQSGPGFAAAAIVFGLAASHLFDVEYGSTDPGTVTQLSQGLPFANAAGLTLLALLIMLVAAGTIMRQRLAHVTFAVIGFGLVIAALPREVSGLALLAGWSLLAVLPLAGERFLIAPSAGPPLDSTLVWFARHGVKLAAAVAAALAIHRAVIYEMPVLTAAPWEAGAPYVGQPYVATAVIILAALAAAAVTVSVDVRQIAVSVAILITAHLAAFSLDLGPAVAVWAALAVLAWGLQQRSSAHSVISWTTIGALLASGVMVTLIAIAPPSRLLITGSAGVDHPFLWSEATLTLGALSSAFFIIARGMKGTSARVWLALGGGLLAIYLLSVGIVDEFQGRVDGAAGVAELRRQSQVALSVVWAILGGITVAAGLIRSIAPLRWFGLGFLALATVKVFFYDLASLDATYRVLSFIGLGILLLLSSYAYRRFGARMEHDGKSPDSIAPSSATGGARQDTRGGNDKLGPLVPGETV